jgi:hypothetical protein
MKLEFVDDNRSTKFDCCPCTHHSFDRDVRGRGVVTIDGQPYSTYADPYAEEVLQFPYAPTQVKGMKFLCPVCRHYPYRIIKNPNRRTR